MARKNLKLMGSFLADFWTTKLEVVEDGEEDAHNGTAELSGDLWLTGYVA